MGARASTLQGIRKLSPAALLAACLALSMSGSGCGTDNSGVSSELFLAPIASPSRIVVIADKLRFLQAIEPTKLPSELELVPTDSFVVGHPSLRQANGTVVKADDLLVYENQSGSLETANLCPSGTPLADCGSVKLNYNRRGIDDEQSAQGSITQGGVISSSVAPIALKNGWILAYDSGARNILAFREEAPRTIQGGTLLPFRGFGPEEGKANKNFGYGNGLVLSLVISGEELARQIKTPSEPIVTRFVELQENKILLFFSTVRAVHLLELSEEETPLVFDLNDPLNADKRLPVSLLRGTVKLFSNASGTSQPFLTFRQIAQEVTGSDNVKIDTFQPVLVPTSGAALVFEQSTSQFLNFIALTDIVDDPDHPGQTMDVITGGTVTRAILPQRVFSVLQEGVGGNVVTPPLGFQGVFYHGSATEICLFEEKTNNLLAYDYTKNLSNNLRTFVSAAGFLQPRGAQGGVVGSEPVLSFAVRDVNDNRLCFDQGQDQLLSVSYSSGVVVLVADRTSIVAATENTLAAFTYIEPLNDTSIRAFDAQSNSLISIELQYATLPVREK